MCAELRITWGMKKIEMYIGPWVGGERATVQFYPESLEVWTIIHENQGKAVSRSIQSLPKELFDLTLSCYRARPEFERHSL